MATREERFGIILDVVEQVAGRAPRVLDLGCGPGSLAARVVARFPGADVVALDQDPVLMLIGRRAYGDLDGRLRWVEADLRRDGWAELLDGPGPFDAVVSTTALHWLAPAALQATYASAASLLRTGGVLVNGDHLFEPYQPRLDALQAALRSTPDDDRELWEPWWEALEVASLDDPELAEAFAERGRRDAVHPEHTGDLPIGAHLEALDAAGFSEVGTVWQHGDDRVLVALRTD